jgi:hypothetical protein
MISFGDKTIPSGAGMKSLESFLRMSNSEPKNKSTFCAVTYLTPRYNVILVENVCPSDF